jgi:hypothetical protein
VEKLEPNNAAKVTGMLLEMDQSEVIHLLESPDALKRKVAEAMEVLVKAASESGVSDQLGSLALNAWSRTVFFFFQRVNTLYIYVCEPMFYRAWRAVIVTGFLPKLLVYLAGLYVAGWEEFEDLRLLGFFWQYFFSVSFIIITVVIIYGISEELSWDFGRNFLISLFLWLLLLWWAHHPNLDMWF